MMWTRTNCRCCLGLVKEVGKLFRLVVSLKERFPKWSKGATGIAPIALTLLGPKEVLLKFERVTSVVEVAMALHALSDWDDLKIQTHCVMARQELLIDMFHEREESEREKQILREEKVKYQSQLGQVVKRTGSQIEQLD